jgi:hypothetical protein
VEKDLETPKTVTHPPRTNAVPDYLTGLRLLSKSETPDYGMGRYVTYKSKSEQKVETPETVTHPPRVNGVPDYLSDLRLLSKSDPPDYGMGRYVTYKSKSAQNVEKETPETVVDLPHTDLRLLSKPDYGMESVKPVGVGIPTSFLPIVEDCTQNEKWKNIKC